MKKFSFFGFLGLALFPFLAHANGGCDVPGATPFLMVYTVNGLGGVPADSAPTTYSDRFLYCFQQGADFFSSRLIIRNMKKGVNESITGNELCRDGFKTYESSRLTGKIIASKMFCDAAESPTPQIKVMLIKGVNLLSGKPKYSTLQMGWTTKPSPVSAPRMSYDGKPLDMMMIEAGLTGVNKVRFTQCKVNFTNCAENPANALLTTTTVRL